MIVAMIRIPYLAPATSTLRRKRIRNHTNDGDHYANQCIRPPLGAAFTLNSTALLVFPPTTTGTRIISTNFTCCHKQSSRASILRRPCQTIQPKNQPHLKSTTPTVTFFLSNSLQNCRPSSYRKGNIGQKTTRHKRFLTHSGGTHRDLLTH